MPDAAQELIALRKTATAQAERFQMRIDAQRESITRLLVAAQAKDPEKAAEEVVRLAGELSIAQQKIREVQTYAEGLKAGGRREWVGTADDILALLQ